MSDTNNQISVLGRPTVYTPEIAEFILSELIEGKSLKSICNAPNMPSAGAVHLWVIDDREGFADRYARARLCGWMVMSEDTLEISDDGSGDVWIDKDGNERVNTDVIARSRLRVDTRKWLLSKMVPRQFGDKIAIGGDSSMDAIKVDLSGLTDDQIAAIKNIKLTD